MSYRADGYDSERFDRWFDVAPGDPPRLRPLRGPAELPLPEWLRSVALQSPTANEKLELALLEQDSTAWRTAAISAPAEPYAPRHGIRFKKLDRCDWGGCACQGYAYFEIQPRGRHRGQE